MLNAEEQIKKFKEFIDSSYRDQLNELIRKGKTSLNVDFKELARFDPDLAEFLLEHPDDAIRASELSIEQFDLPQKNYRVRYYNLPETQNIRIKDVRSEHLGKFLAIMGIVRQASDVRPQVINAKFECPACGNTITILQVDSKFKEPTRCTCGKRGRFRLLTKELVDVQRLTVEEAPETLEGGEQPKRLNVFLKEDLVEPFMEKKTTPGSKIRVSGIIKEVPVFLKTGAQSTRYDLMMESNFIEPIEETYEEVTIGKEDEEKIKILAKDPRLYEKLIKSIAPSIYGHDEIKEALILQLLGGVKKEKSDGTTTRGDMHVLLVGDPGAAKSTILMYISKAAPKARYVAGRGVTGTGITASVVKDDFLKGWALEAGALVLANKGILCLHPETKVILNNEIKKIEEFFDEKNIKFAKQGNEIIEYCNINENGPNLDTKSLSLINTNIAKIRRKNYKGKLLKLEFRSGFSIKLTPDHKLLDGDYLEWKAAKEFSKNNKVIAPLKLPENNNKLYILDLVPDSWKVILNKKEKEEIKLWIKKDFKSLSDFNKKLNLDKNYLSGGKQLTIKSFKEILNYFGKYEEFKKIPFRFCRSHGSEKLKIAKIIPEFGYILGFLYGDGSIRVNKRRTAIALVQSLKHKKYIDQFNKCWSSIFNKEMGYIEGKKDSIIRGKSTSSICRQMYYGSNLLGELFNSFIKDDLSHILKLDNETLYSFIAGVMDSDGCICTKKNGKYVVQHVDFMFSPKNKSSNLNFILALRRLDCYGKIIQQRGNYLVELTGREDVRILKEEIGNYSIKLKEAKILERITNISSISQKIPSFITARLCRRISESINKSILLKEGIWSTIYNFKEQEIQPSREQLLKIKNKLCLSEDINNEINFLIKRDYFLDEIVSVKEEDYNGYVYDFFVPENNNFVAEGIIVHNCLDELDKMSEEDTSALHEAMAQQQISISKANIQATLRAETTLLAAANPKLGRFDPYQPIAKQINLPSTLINRFDLIFTIRDLPDKKTDDKIASHILAIQKDKDSIEPEIEVKLFKKYISYAKQKVSPQLTDSAIEEIKRFYVELRNSGSTGDDAIRPIPISARQLEALVRLAEASAKARLSNKVTKLDAERAIRILKSCLMQVGFDYETGKIDMDYTTGIPSAQRGKIVTVKEIIDTLEKKNKTIPIEEIISEAGGKGLNEAKVEEIIEKLKRDGEIFEPRTGFISKL